MTPRKVRERDVRVTVETPEKTFRGTEVEMENTPDHETRPSMEDVDEITPVYAPEPEPERENVD